MELVSALPRNKRAYTIHCVLYCQTLPFLCVCVFLCLCLCLCLPVWVFVLVCVCVCVFWIAHVCRDRTVVGASFPLRARSIVDCVGRVRRFPREQHGPSQAVTDPLRLGGAACANVQFGLVRNFRLSRMTTLGGSGVGSGGRSGGCRGVPEVSRTCVPKLAVRVLAWAKFGATGSTFHEEVMLGGLGSSSSGKVAPAALRPCLYLERRLRNRCPSDLRTSGRSLSIPRSPS